MGWVTEHLRPRDVFILAAIGLLAILGLVVWTQGAVDSAFRSQVMTGVLTAMTTLAGYYLGNRNSEKASERADEAQRLLAKVREELASTRKELEATTDDLAETVTMTSAVEGVQPTLDDG